MPNTVYSTYGMTETLSHIALRRLNGPEASPYYHPFPSVTLSLSPENTLVIDAPLVCDERLVTNDVARLLPDGSFAIIGRKDNIINSGGIKIQIEEVEERLRPYLDRPYAITAAPDPRLGEAVVLLLASNLRGEMLTDGSRQPAQIPPSEAHHKGKRDPPNRKRQDRPCRLPGASEKYHYKNTINMKRILTITAVSLLALSPMYGQDSCRYPQDPTLEKSQAYAGYDCVTLLDSTAVTVQPTGSGAFAVCKAFKVQTSKGAVANRIIKYDYDPADGARRVSLRHDLPCERRRDQSRRNPSLRLRRPRTCHLLAPGRSCWKWAACNREISWSTRSPRKVSPTPC